jgi:5-methylcytosine-specific restriction endonuclease McrA
MRWRKASDASPDPLVCMGCRRTGAGIPHGVTRYKRYGCRCDDCKAIVAADARGYRAMYREREGVSVSSKRTTTTLYYWVAPPTRQAIYDRDGWVCQLCSAPVDPSLDPNDRFAATLDHVECQSWALIPDHSPKNLRLAHRACNSRRRDQVDG